MQFLSTIAILASAAIVSAIPMAGEQPAPAPINNTGNACKVDQTQACCKTDSAGVLGGLLGGSCELNILGQNCAFQSACCQVDGSGSILGGSCAPIINL